MTPEEAMVLALEEAKKGRGFVAPNPLVGCVILDADYHFLSKGYHTRAGAPHAEIEALNAIKDPLVLKGAHVFVTLEPCAHHGKTPPCAEALSRFPIASVTYGLKDPFPFVDGKGLQILQDAGIKVQQFPGLQNELCELVEIFLHNQIQKRPFVGLKMVTSQDNYIGLKTSQQFWLSGKESREYVHELRADYDAILVGRKTVEIDDPQLNIRFAQRQKENKVIVLDPQGKILTGSERKIFSCHSPNHLFFCIDEKASVNSHRATVWKFPYEEKLGFQLDQILKKAYDNKITSILVEGGGETVDAFVSQSVWQRYYWIRTSKVIGPERGLAWKGLPLLQKMRKSYLGSDELTTGVS